MKVLHFVTGHSRHNLLLDVAVELRRQGVEVVLGSLDEPGPLQEGARAAGIEPLALACRSRRDYAAAVPRLALHLRRGRFDVVHTHLLDATVVGLSAARLGGVPGRVMTRHHADERLVYGSRVGVLVDRLVERLLCRYVVAPSADVVRVLRDVEKIPVSMIRQVPNGHDWERVRSSPEAAQAVRAELGLGDELVLCQVGGIRRGPGAVGYTKGQDRLLRAVAAAGLPPETRIIIVGGGDRRELEALATQLGLRERCLFLGHRDDCFDVMSAADLLVHPSLSEAYGLVVAEALALGRPVVATDVGAARDVVIPGRTGWLLPVRDDDALAGALADAASDRARLRAFGEAGRRVVHATFSIEQMASGYRAIYEEAVG